MGLVLVHVRPTVALGIRCLNYAARRVRSRRVLFDVARAPWPGKGWTTLLMQFLRRVRIRSFTLETPMAAYFFVDPRRRRNTYDAVRMKPVNRLRGSVIREGEA